MSSSSIQSPPIKAFAASRSSKYIITAYSNSPALYLQELDSFIPSVPFLPHATYASVSAIEFHPESEEIFLLGYTDGTISLHTTSRILLMHGTAAGSDGNLAHLKGSRKRQDGVTAQKTLKRPEHRLQERSFQVKGSRSIVAVAFLPGYSRRVVSLCSNGRCRIVDFERGAAILRTWELRTRCVRLAIYSQEQSLVTQQRAGFSVRHSALPRPEHVIAVSRADGQVQLFDAAGLLLGDTVEEKHEVAHMDSDWNADPAAREVLPQPAILRPTSNRAELAPHFTPKMSRQKQPSFHLDPSLDLPDFDWKAKRPSQSKQPAPEIPARPANPSPPSDSPEPASNFSPKTSRWHQPSVDVDPPPHPPNSAFSAQPTTDTASELSPLRPRINSLHLHVPGAWISTDNYSLASTPTQDQSRASRRSPFNRRNHTRGVWTTPPQGVVTIPARRAVTPPTLRAVTPSSDPVPLPRVHHDQPGSPRPADAFTVSSPPAPNDELCAELMLLRGEVAALRKTLLVVGVERFRRESS